MLFFDAEAAREQIQFLISQYFDDFPDDDKRNKFITLRLTEAERDRVKRHAEYLRISASEYIRMGILLLDFLLAILKGWENEA